MYYILLIAAAMIYLIMLLCEGKNKVQTWIIRCSWALVAGILIAIALSGLGVL